MELVYPYFSPDTRGYHGKKGVLKHYQLGFNRREKNELVVSVDY
jgi:hypothetical protein